MRRRPAIPPAPPPRRECKPPPAAGGDEVRAAPVSPATPAARECAAQRRIIPQAHPRELRLGSPTSLWASPHTETERGKEFLLPVARSGTKQIPAPAGQQP